MNLYICPVCPYQNADGMLQICILFLHKNARIDLNHQGICVMGKQEINQLFKVFSISSQ